MTTLNFGVTTDFSASVLNTVDVINFTGGAAPVTGTFANTQFNGTQIFFTVLIDGVNGRADNLVVNGGFLDASLWTFVRWTSGVDTITLNGTAASETITGSTQSDFIFAGQANDTLYGGASDDILAGGSGDDSMFGGANNDTMLMDDFVNPSATNGTDIGHGDEGNDLLWGYGGNDTLYGGDDNDSLVGNDFASTVAGTDQMFGGAGNDQFFVGLGGSAMMDGGADNDTFFGGALADTLRGGLGNDYMFGAAGADIFQFFLADFAAGNSDIVYFVDTVDRLRFSASMSGSLSLINTVLQYDANPAHTVASVYITVALGGGQTAAIAVYGTTVAQLTPMLEFVL
jgi:Ca2+-binding RTX toxin-like protein